MHPDPRPIHALLARCKGQKTVVLWEDGSENLDLLGKRCDIVLPVQEHASLADHGHEVHLRIRLTQAVVRTCAKDEPVLDLLVSGP